MSYEVIARKWRPQTFGDLVGQAHVTETLQNAIRNDRVAHAYIFSGARGVGKTTAARILAKALNCVNGPTPEPCGVCDSCKEIAAGTSLDVIEIAAASNRGIDQIRELREMVRYAPAAARSKVVILDEAHMLTGEAPNALLKTPEVPPGFSAARWRLRRSAYGLRRGSPLCCAPPPARNAPSRAIRESGRCRGWTPRQSRRHRAKF